MNKNVTLGDLLKEGKDKKLEMKFVEKVETCPSCNTTVTSNRIKTVRVYNMNDFFIKVKNKGASNKVIEQYKNMIVLDYQEYDDHDFMVVPFGYIDEVCESCMKEDSNVLWEYCNTNKYQ